MVAEIIVTQEGLEKLKTELRELVAVRRPKVIRRIQNAKEYGDLSENSEYEDARNEQSFVEGRIRELEYKIKHSRVADRSPQEGIDVGSVVTCRSKDGLESTYQLVGAHESDPSSGKISVDSPFGRALVGAKAGDSVEVETPEGRASHVILSVK